MLVVDEHAGDRSLIADGLRSHSFEVVECRSAEEALVARERDAIDVVVLHLPIPEPQSFEICRRLKDASSHMLPVLYVSSRTSRDARVRALNAGIDGYLAHPFDADELRATVAALVRLRREEKTNVLGAARDRERLVESLERERSRLAAIFEEAPAFLAVLSGPDYVFERINPAYLQLVGHRDPVGKPLLLALPELEGQGYVELLEAVRTTGAPFVGKHMPVKLTRMPDGPLELRYVDLVYLRLTDADGAYSVVAHGVDVTDQVVAIAALERTEQRLRDQFAKIPVPTYLFEARGDDFAMVDFNEAAVRTFPLLGASAVGRQLSELFPSLHELRDEFRRCLGENLVLRLSVNFDDGPSRGTIPVDLTIGPQQPDRVLVHAVDVGARAALEAQLRQSQKMEAVGQLAGGVAHDFNNLLTVIGAHSSLLLDSIDEADPCREDAEEIQKAVIRAGQLTRQLLAFSRKQILKPERLDLNALIEDTRKMLERVLGEDIEIVVHFGSGLGAILADATQIDQVLVNLAVNARDAMPDGGVLTIATRKLTIAKDFPGAQSVIPFGDYILLEVTDTGVGMEAEVHSRLFEPFFTTKPLGKGTGLGLATVYGIVRQSLGFIFVDSTPGKGATFRLYFPATLSPVTAIAPQAADVLPPAGVETILLIEDEPAVREVVQRILARQGYVVLLAASGAEALAVSAAFDSAIQLVVSDAVMPGMTGAEAVRQLQLLRPDLKALFMSGYTDDEILRRGIVSSATAFIQKPFTLLDFSRAVRDALDA